MIVISFVLVQCTKTNSITENNNTENKDNTEFINKSKIIELLAEKGITVVNNDDTELELRNDFCYQYSGADTCYLVGDIHDTVFIPNVCNEAAVTYKLYWCSAQGVINITDFRAKPLKPACDNIWDYWASLANQSKYTELSMSIDSFEYAASKEAEDNIGYVFALAFGFFCPNDLLRINYHTQLCYNYCLKFTKKGDWPPFEIFKVNCGTKCCKRTRMLCVLSTGGVYTSNEIYELLGGSCDNGNVDLWSECDGGFILGECTGRECGPPPTN